MKTTEPIGLYLHIPFCLRKCNYCDFCSFADTTEREREDYVTSLCREIGARADALGHPTADSVFFGGGTPSLLTAGQMERILAAIAGGFPLTRDCEITAEVNPATADRARLSAYRAAGVNRLSVGMQSGSDRELELLGRVHRHADFLRTVEALLSAGFRNWNADVMLGIPGQSRGSLAETLDGLLSLAPTHISAYMLQIEEGTPFYRERDSLALPDDETTAALYLDTCRRLREAGYAHYEISNFALPGRECRHNLRYWLGGVYYGFGIAAHSYDGTRRYYNGCDLATYSAGNCVQQPEDRPQDAEERRREYIMLRLRLAHGIDTAEYRRRFGEDFAGRYEPFLRDWMSHGLMEQAGARIFLTERGMLVSNGMLEALLFGDTVG